MSSKLNNDTGADQAAQERDFDARAAGNLIVISAPSGAGKTSLVKAALADDPTLFVSVSHTTRTRRPDEVDGENYHFTSAADFSQMIEEGGFIEHAEVFGNWYGTSHAEVARRLAANEDVLLEIDWQGAHQIRSLYPGAILIFILPPSLAELQRRLRGRGSDADAVIARRLAQAADDMLHCRSFDYLIVNDVFDVALEQLLSIVSAARLSTTQQSRRHAALLDELLPQST